MQSPASNCVQNFYQNKMSFSLLSYKVAHANYRLHFFTLRFSHNVGKITNMFNPSDTMMIQVSKTFIFINLKSL